MRKAGLIIISLFFTQLCFAQTNWEKIFSAEGIVVSSMQAETKVENGHTQLRYFIKIENSGSVTKSIEWDLKLKDQNGVCFTCNNSSEHHKIIKVGSGETLNGFESKQRELFVTMKFIDIKVAKELSEVKLENIKVTDIN